MISLLLKKLSLEHALEQDQLFDELAQEDEQIDKLAANRSDLDAAIKDQLERCQKKRLQKHTLQSLKKVSRRAAAFLVVFLAGFTVLFFTVDAVKLNVVEFIVRSHEDVHPIPDGRYVRKYAGGHSGADRILLPASLLHSGTLFGSFLSLYSGTRLCWLRVSGYTVHPFLFLHGVKYLHLSGHRGLYARIGIRQWLQCLSVHQIPGRSQGNTSLIWHDENYIYLISGPVNQHEILKIAESLY